MSEDAESQERSTDPWPWREDQENMSSDESYCRHMLTLDNRLNLWRHLPGEESVSPRDQKVLEKSGDSLFLFKLLSWRDQGCRRVAVYREGKRFIYLMQSAGGELLHPMTGRPIEPTVGWLPKGTIKIGTLEKQLKWFWYFRRYGQWMGRGQANYTLCADGVHLGTDGRADPAAIAVAKERWRGWALDDCKDEVLDHVKDLKYMSVSASETLDSGKDTVYCPLDGSVRFIVGEFKSPTETWRMMCGRHWVYALCPKCLGSFSVNLISMN